MTNVVEEVNVRRVLVGLCLGVLSCAILEAQPTQKRAKSSPRVARPTATSRSFPTLPPRIWQRLFGIYTMDDPPPPPPPERGQNPVPG